MLITKDWTGNSRSILAQIGASTYSLEEREANDYYATDPKALIELLKVFDLPRDIPVWECACGGGHLVNVLWEEGYRVLATDLFDRGCPKSVGGIDFLKSRGTMCNILTNPPYKYATEFVRHGLEILNDGNYLIAFLKLSFCEGKGRRALFKENPPKYVYVSSGRILCGKNGDFEALKKSGFRRRVCVVYMAEGFQRRNDSQMVQLRRLCNVISNNKR